MYIAPTPRIFLRMNYLQQGAVGEPYDHACLIVLSFTAQSSSINLTSILLNRKFYHLN